MDILDTAITFLSEQSPYLLLPLLPVIPWYGRKRSERKARKREEHEKKMLTDFYGLVTSMRPEELRALLYVNGCLATKEWNRFTKPHNAEMAILLLRCGMVCMAYEGHYSLTNFGRRVLPETQILVRKELELHGGADPAQEIDP